MNRATNGHGRTLQVALSEQPSLSLAFSWYDDIDQQIDEEVISRDE